MFTLSFETDNAAFDENPTDEVIRILQDVKEKIDIGLKEGPVYDINGNNVGKFSFNKKVKK